MDFDRSKEQELQDIQERVVRITEAVYRTTDVFSDVEPLKWALRESAVQIVNMITSGSRHDYNRATMLVQAMILKLRLAASGAFVARANFDVLERAYRDLQNNLGDLSRDTILLPSITPISLEKLLDIRITDKKDKNMSDNMSEIQLGEARLSITEVERDSFIKRDVEVGVSMPPHVSRQGGEQATSKDQKTVSIQQQKKKYEPRAGSVSGDDRKISIINLIRERGPSSVGDLSPLLGMSVSEKTVQRDLNALADAGILKREGEKRWRRYFIAQ